MPTPSELARQAEQLNDVAWFDFLDELDEVSRRRSERASGMDAPSSSRLEDIVAWVVKKHFIVERAVREIRYLPSEAPEGEIRLLEVNDELADADSPIAPLDLGLEIEGARYALLVADVTSAQLQEIERDPSKLPPGWSLANSRVWRRGA